MNKKNQYLKTKNREGNLDGLELFFLFHDTGGGCCFMTDDAMRRAWESNREYILDLWRRLFPGTRPRVFWRYDYPESRARLIQQAQARIEADPNPGIAKYYRATAPNPLDESDELDRLGLLDPDEKAADFQMPNLPEFVAAYLGQ